VYACSPLRKGWAVRLWWAGCYTGPPSLVLRPPRCFRGQVPSRSVPGSSRLSYAGEIAVARDRAPPPAIVYAPPASLEPPTATRSRFDGSDLIRPGVNHGVPVNTTAAPLFSHKSPSISVVLRLDPSTVRILKI
jgi:hypothetical protein